MNQKKNENGHQFEKQRRLLRRLVFALGLVVLTNAGPLHQMCLAQPQVMQKVKQFQELLRQKKQSAADTTRAEQLNEQSRQAARQGNQSEAQHLLDEAIAALAKNEQQNTQAPETRQAPPGSPATPHDRGQSPKRLLAEFKQLLQSAKASGKDTAEAERLERESGMAARSGDRNKAQELLGKAVESLGGNPTQATNTTGRRGKPEKKGARPDRPRPDMSACTGGKGSMPVFVLPFSHHYDGPGGYYARPEEVRNLAEFFHKNSVPGTLFFDGILVDMLQKTDPGIFAVINSYNLPLGYHGEETHGPYPVPSDLFAEVYPLKEAQGYRGTWSQTAGKGWDIAVKAVTDRYSHALAYSIDEQDRMLDRRRETPDHLPAVGGLKLVQEAFGRDVSFMPSHGLESAPEGFAFRKMSRFGLDQPSVPTALHALKIFKIGHVARQVMAIAGQDVSIFWYMGRLTSKGDDLGEASWTPKTLEDLQNIDRTQPRLLLMGFSRFDKTGALKTIAGLREFFAANPGSDWVTGDTIQSRFEGEKAFIAGKDDIAQIAATVLKTWNARPPDMIVLPGRTLSLCDAFEILCKACADAGKTNSLPAQVAIAPLYGPILEDGNSLLKDTCTFSLAEIADAASQALATLNNDSDRFVPAKTKIAGKELNPAEFLYALAAAVEFVNAGGRGKITVQASNAFPPYADLLMEIYKPKTTQPLCYTNAQLWTVKPARINPKLVQAPQTVPVVPSSAGTDTIINPLTSTHGTINVVFAANFDSQGGCFREDPTGADLYSGCYDLKARVARDIKRLTSYSGSAEWFPSLSCDGQWVAYNRTIFQGGRGRDRQEIRAINLSSGADTLLLENSRFPCFTPDGKQLVFSVQQRGSSQICAAEFLIDPTGKPSLGTRKLVADQRYGADKVEDPSVLADGKRIAFHRKENSQGAGGAVIGLDGNGFQAITPLVGAGHAAASPDGKTISFSVSRDGRIQLVQETQSGWSRPTDVNLSNVARDFASYDSRFLTVPAIAHTYMEWVAPDLMLLSSQASDGRGTFSFSRMFLLQFSNLREKPVIHDISSSFETVTGKKGRDFCTGCGILKEQ